MLYEFDTPAVMRLLQLAGVDFAIFDLEHTGWDPGTLRPLFATGRGTGVETIVRVGRADSRLIAAALDAGAGGVMASMVESVEEAELLVSAAKYPPQGHRGFGLLLADDLQGGPAAAVERANESTLVIAQIETAAGIDHAEAIVAVDGVDLVWLGQFDLTLSLGVPGDFAAPRYTEAVAQLVSACRRAGKPLGQMVRTPEEGRALRAAGLSVFAYADVWIFEDALRAQLEALRGAER
jgi:2-dehydro-3-deoxyglucarate aldolase/4-hydroxy-2-oxoheptanedioate aldolase